jgi:hypothetical protein
LGVVAVVVVVVVVVAEVVILVELAILLFCSRHSWLMHCEYVGGLPVVVAAGGGGGLHGECWGSHWPANQLIAVVTS